MVAVPEGAAGSPPLQRVVKRKSLHGAHAYQLVETNCGGIAQLGERLLCKQEVIGSIPFASTNDIFFEKYLQKLSVSCIMLNSCKS